MEDILKAPPLLIIILFLIFGGCGSGVNGGNRSGVDQYAEGVNLGSADGTIGDGGSSGSGESGGNEGSEPASDPPSDKYVTLSWERPASNGDGSELNDLAGYKIYYGLYSSVYTQSIDVGNIRSAVISSLSSGTWCFATTAYDLAGNESSYSNEVCKTI